MSCSPPSLARQTQTFLALSIDRSFKKNGLFAFILLAVTALSFLPYILQSSESNGPAYSPSSSNATNATSSSLSPFSNASSTTNASSVPSSFDLNSLRLPRRIWPNQTYGHFYVNVSALNKSDQDKLAPLMEKINANPFNETVKIANLSYGTFIIEFETPRKYTIKQISSNTVSHLYYCISSTVSCSSIDDYQTVSVLKMNIDAALTLTDISSVTLNAARYSSNNFKLNLNSFISIFFIVLGSPIVSALLEDKAKGIKFGLFMTGLRRSAYYLGSFLIPVILALAYSGAIVYCSLKRADDTWAEARTPLTILLYCSSFSYLGVFWLISQLVSNERNANVFVLLYSIVGFIGVTDLVKETLIILPPFLNIFFCFNPLYAYSAYIVIANMSPYGPGLSNQSVSSSSTFLM